MCENSRLRGQALGPRQHIFAVRRDLMEPHTYTALLAAARVVLHARNGKLSDQLVRAEDLSGARQRNEAAGELEDAADRVEPSPGRPAGKARHGAATPRSPTARGWSTGTATAALPRTGGATSCAFPAARRPRIPGST